MPLFEWTEELSVGVEEFDSHHKRLIEIINKLYDASVTGDVNAIMDEVLVELSNYTMYHFLGEEEAMQKVGYPDYPRHKESHLYFVQKTFDFAHDFRERKSGLSQDMLAFLRDWLVEHIMKTDKGYTNVFHLNGVF